LEAEPTGLGNQNAAVVRLHYEAFSAGDLSALLAGLSTDVAISIHDEHGKAGGEPIRGRDEARRFFEGIHAAVADPEVEIHRLRADGDRVLAQVSLGGTLRETGRSGRIPAVHLFTLHDGLITEIRTHRPDWRNYGGDPAVHFPDSPSS
jgi:ketosteroid isomerase-like protein